jgi:hypothetical protein
MKIAVTLVGIRDTQFSSTGRFIWKWLEAEIHAHPQHQFILLSDTTQPTSFVGAPNLSWVKTKFNRSSVLASTIWYDYTAPALLKKLHVDTWLQLSGGISRNAKVSQISLYEGISGILQQYFFRHATKNVKRWLVLEPALGTQLQEQFLVDKKQITLLSLAASSEIYPIDYSLQQMYKGTHAGGTEYFLSVVTDGTTSIELLQSFSLFKKWQQSNMKLLLLPGSGLHRSFLEDKLKNYKYKSDVLLVPQKLTVHNWYQILSSAYAIVLLSNSSASVLTLLEAAKAGVSIIGPSDFINNLGYQNFCTPYSQMTPSAIAEMLLLLYKNEKLKSERAQNGLLHLQNNPAEPATLLFQDPYA